MTTRLDGLIESIVDEIAFFGTLGESQNSCLAALRDNSARNSTTLVYLARRLFLSCNRRFLETPKPRSC